MEDADTDTRRTAYGAVAAILDATAPVELGRLLRSDPDARIRKMGAEALVDRADGSTWRVAFDLLSRHESSQMRVLGARIATRHADDSARSALELLACDADGHVGKEAGRALDRLQGGAAPT